MLSDKLKNRILSVYPYVFPILLFAVLEMQNNTSVYKNISAIVITVIFLYVSILVLFTMTGSVFVSGLVTAFVLQTYYVACFYRQMQTGQVLVPHDLNLLKHISSLFSFASLPIHWRPMSSIIFSVGLLIPLFHASSRFRLNAKKRILILLCSGVFVYFTLFMRYSENSLLLQAKFDETENSSYNSIYREQGAILGFYIVGLTDDADEPYGYSSTYMQSLYDKIVPSETPSNHDDEINPNVIVVMSEAFWDPTNLTNVTFSADPMPNFRRLCENATSGNVIPPTFGGMTCNTEFEFLTGHSMEFIGFGDTPYYDQETYINSDMGRSLVSMFAANGYRTVALHTYTGTFFSRDEIYPTLGFDTFIAEEDMVDARYKGSLRGQALISDEYFCDELIRVIEDTDEPLFMFGISVQNHTPYLPDRYESSPIHVDSGDLLDEDETGYLETFANGVYDADVVLGRLYDYVMATEEPTILLYFGDHLPLLSMHTDVYTDLGYVRDGDLDELSIEEAYRLFSTPYIAFSNHMDLPSTWGDVSPYFLGALLADSAGVEMNMYYHFLVQAFEQFQAMNRYLFIADGIIYGQPRNIDSGITDMFQAFQYDKLFGEGYLDTALSSIER